MKYLSEFRDASVASRLLRQIRTRASRTYTIMEICGGQTHTIVRHGLDQLLEPQVRLVHGPGCPVCVTPAAVIDHAIEIAHRPDVVLCSFGDMLRVPGSSGSLLDAKAAGADVRVLYSPMDALDLARTNPIKEVVFFGVGFETTAPVHASLVLRAQGIGLRNLTVLLSHALVPPAVMAILEAPGCEVEAFLAAGHVCAVAGWTEYEPIAARFRVPIVVTGFELVDMLYGILGAVAQLESGTCNVENRYARAVRREGNGKARQAMAEVLETCDREWRGIGAIPQSGLRLRPGFAAFDAALRFPATSVQPPAELPCIAGLVLSGRRRPSECPSFGTACTPERPLGAPMVSTEGACAAWHAYARTN